MSSQQINFSQIVVERINYLQAQGGAQGALSILRKAINCTVSADEFETAEYRLDLIRELMWLEDVFKDFEPQEEKGGKQ